MDRGWFYILFFTALHENVVWFVKDVKEVENKRTTQRNLEEIGVEDPLLRCKINKFVGSQTHESGACIRTTGNRVIILLELLNTTNDVD